MKVAIVQSNYLPWRGYFDLIKSVDLFCFYDEVKYTKNDWRNRNKIYSYSGTTWLSIPIYKDAVNQKISEVIFKDNSWQDNHYKTLWQAYSKAPYFYQLIPILEDLYKSQQWNHLSYFNQYTIQKIATLLGISTKFVNSKDFYLKEGRVERLIDLLQQLGATEYLSGPSAKEYLKGSEELFNKNNIKLIFKSYPSYPQYPQLVQPFEPYVSILDLIANIPINKIGIYI